MKNLILSLVLALFCFNAFSLTVNTDKKVDSESVRTGAVSFKVDKNNMGRAWLEVDIDTEDIDDFWTYTEKVKVPGLVYDQKSGKILLKSEDKNVTCANVKVKTRRNIFTRRTSLRHKISKTNNCHVSVKLEEREEVLDTGFDLQRRTSVYLVVSLDVAK